jgi:hypothetical protein
MLRIYNFIKMKKTFLLLFLFNTLIASAQKVNYSLFTYTTPTQAKPDETDPLQKVYFFEATKKVYLIITVWQKQKANKTAADDYVQFIKLVKQQYHSIKDYTREPEIVTEAKTKIKSQTAYIKGSNYNILTNKSESLSIMLKVFTKNKYTAAVHFASNDIDRCKGEMNTFLKTFKVK